MPDCSRLQIRWIASLADLFMFNGVRLSDCQVGACQLIVAPEMVSISNYSCSGVEAVSMFSHHRILYVPVTPGWVSG